MNITGLSESKYVLGLGQRMAILYPSLVFILRCPLSPLSPYTSLLLPLPPALSTPPSLYDSNFPSLYHSISPYLSPLLSLHLYLPLAPYFPRLSISPPPPTTPAHSLPS